MTGVTPLSQDMQPDLLSGYVVPPNVADELFDADGVMRPVWVSFIEQLSRLSPFEVAERFARGDQYLREAGVYFRQYSNDPLQDRDWPLSHVPVLLHEREWTTICAGLSQRAELLEQVMADLYGPAQLVANGHLPAELIARNPLWLRPMVGIAPASGHYLHFLAFEIGRGPDGSWFVLGDRAQAPSGAGFALENRMATTRVFSDPMPRNNIHRLAGFFRAFRAAMDAMPGAAGRRTAILTPGPNNDTYYEQTYIARYLGLMLLEGEDIIVRNGEAMVRTVEGLEPLGVLWRRLDAEFADPLELDGRSRIGTPGLLDAVRQGNLNVVNALGSGVLETRAMMAFLPKIAEVLLGQPLAMPNIATWWCGQPAERKYVKAHTDRMMIGDAMTCDLPFDIDTTTALGGKFRGAGHPPIDEWIESRAPFLVGQEAVTLSTTPAYHGGHLVPRPMTVRVIAARTPQGWTFMPGGYARIGQTEDATALAMQRGGSVADVWIISDAPVPQETLLTERDYRRTAPGVLPSRAADNLFWLGRYVERTEGVIRLLRAFHLRLAETGDPSDPRLQLLEEFLDGFGIELKQPIPDALIDLLDAAKSCAAKVRDRFSVDGWTALQDLSKTVRTMAQTAHPGDDCARAMSVLLRKITGFSGLVHENMYRFDAWRFLSFGRALERADGHVAVLAAFAEDGAALGALDIAIEYGDSVMTHQRRYRTAGSRETVIDLLALDGNNPRAILFQLNAMRELAAELPNAEKHGRPSPLLGALLSLQTDLTVAKPHEMTTKRLIKLRRKIAETSGLLSDAYLR